MRAVWEEGGWTNLLPQLLHLVHHLSSNPFFQHLCTGCAVQEDQDLRVGQREGQGEGQGVGQGVGQRVGWGDRDGDR